MEKYLGWAIYPTSTNRTWSPAASAPCRYPRNVNVWLFVSGFGRRILTVWMFVLSLKACSDPWSCCGIGGSTIHRRKEVRHFLVEHPRIHMNTFWPKPMNLTLKNMFGIKLTAPFPRVHQRGWISSKQCSQTTHEEPGIPKTPSVCIFEFVSYLLAFSLPDPTGLMRI